PCWAVGVGVRSDEPSGNVPELSLVSWTVPHASDPTAWPTSTPDATPGPVHSAVRVRGQVMPGGVVSTTLTVCVADAELLLVSFAVHTTCVVPSGSGCGASFVTIKALSHRS